MAPVAVAHAPADDAPTSDETNPFLVEGETTNQTPSVVETRVTSATIPRACAPGTATVETPPTSDKPTETIVRPPAKTPTPVDPPPNNPPAQPTPTTAPHVKTRNDTPLLLDLTDLVDHIDSVAKAENAKKTPQDNQAVNRKP